MELLSLHSSFENTQTICPFHYFLYCYLKNDNECISAFGQNKYLFEKYHKIYYNIYRKLRKKEVITIRIWHQKLIPYLDRQRLLGQHRECAALRGKGWGKKHATVDYAFTHDPALLVAYHYLIMDEMEKRGYHPDKIWKNPNWRGSTLGEDTWISDSKYEEIYESAKQGNMIYPEHDDVYLQECINILHEKGIDITM